MSTAYNGPSVEEKLTEKATVLMVRVKNYQYVLDGKELTITEQMKGLEHLQEKFDALEKLYMVIFEEQKGRAGSPFDHNREVDELIYECGQSLDELKEQVEQTRQDEPTCEAPPSPPPHPTHSSVSHSMSSLPVHVSPSNRTGKSSGVRGHKVARGRMRSSRSVVVQSCLDIFLNDNE